MKRIILLICSSLLFACANAPIGEVADDPTLVRPTSSPQPTNTSQPTRTRTPIPTDTPEPTSTPVPPIPTDTPEPTDTATPRPTRTTRPTNTPQPTDPPTPVPTDTLEPTSTSTLTPVPPAPTSIPTNTPDTPEPTATPFPTNTPPPPDTPTPIPTNTSEPTSTPVPTDRPLPTNTPQPTWTPLPTATPFPTNTPPPPTPIPTNTPPPAAQQFNEVVMVSFDTAASSRNWYIVNDSVMGGVSTSSAAIREPGVMVFSGTVSLDNNGGFASVRSVQADWNTAGTNGVRIRVLGDGKTYRFEVNTDQTYATYDTRFTTVAGEWREFVLRYDEFTADYRGVPVDAPPIDPARITSLGFMIQDYQTGRFWLSVDWIRGIK